MIINTKFLAKYSPYPRNYNFDEVMNYVDLAERIWLLPIIGEEFYDELKEQVSENTLSDENSTALVEAIWPFLGFAVAYEALPLTWADITEVGVTKGHSDNSDSLSLKDMTYIEGHLRRKVEALKDHLIHWLDEHSESFPLYHPTNCGCNVCNSNAGKLNKPNPYLVIYSTNRKKTDID